MGEKIADVEAAGPDPGELAVDDLRLLQRDHDRAGVEIAVQQRLRLGQIGEAQPRHGAFHLDVAAQRRGPWLERRRNAVALARRVRVEEDEIGRNALQREVLREQREVGGARLERLGEIGGADARLRHIFGDVGGDARIAAAGDQALAQDDVRIELLHHDQQQIGVEVVDRRGEAADERRDALGVGRFEARAVGVERPSILGDAHVGQPLLGADAAVGPVDQIDGVEIAVGDVARAPVFRLAAEPRPYVRQRGQDLDDARGVKDAIGARPVAGGRPLRSEGRRMPVHNNTMSTELLALDAAASPRLVRRGSLAPPAGFGRWT